MSQKHKIGNEFDSGRGRVLDLRQNLKPVVKTAEKITIRAVTPQINLKPVRDEITIQPASWALNGVAYDLLTIVVLGFISVNTVYREWAFLAYFLFVLFLRIPSQRVFRTALISLILVPLVLSLHREKLGDNFAIFAFYFMAVGVIRAIIELRKDDWV